MNAEHNFTPTETAINAFLDILTTWLDEKLTAIGCPGPERELMEWEDY